MQLNRRNFIAASTAALAASCATKSSGKSPFSIANYGKTLTVLENEKPVFVFNTAPVDPPAGVDERFRRSDYIHPLHSPSGAIVTEDFPKDHYHHRGVFWAWPNCRVNGRKLNIWELETGRSVFGQWTRLEILRDEAHLEGSSQWKFDDDGFAPISEQVALTVHRTKDAQRAIDFKLTFTNIADADVSFQGSDASGGTVSSGAPKGYGGFSYRPDANDKPFTFTSINGIEKEDRMSCETPWANVSWGATEMRGVAIIQHPTNPGYPHPGWMFRHYGFLGASWPHNDPHTLKPGESFTLGYRLVVHEGDASDADIKSAAAHYAATK